MEELTPIGVESKAVIIMMMMMVMTGYHGSWNSSFDFSGPERS